MRFRLIEKDTVGTGTEFVQADKKTMANSKTYIPKPRSKKVDMNKIKNTKIGDDIHYYINGVEGRGIVVKMANEYLEVFKENGQLGTIHINDTFFVKDILVNKQWNDMDDQERYEALNKIHAPTPRFIMKAWEDLPGEIQTLLRKEGGNMAGGTGSTMEEGESKEAETKDHARTGFAQNTQYAKKATGIKGKYMYGGQHVGDIKDFDKAKWFGHVTLHNMPEMAEYGTLDHEATVVTEDGEEHKSKRSVGKAKKESKDSYYKKFGHSGERKQTRAGQEKEILGHHTAQSGTVGGRWAAEQQSKKEKEMAEAKAKEVAAKKKEPAKEKPKTDDRPDPNNPRFTMSGKLIPRSERQHTKEERDTKKAWEVWLDRQEKSHDSNRNRGRVRPKKEPDLLEADKADELNKGPQLRYEDSLEDSGLTHEERRKKRAKKKKSDVEHGRYSNPGGTPEVGVSTDTKVDVAEDTGYEERPHISVEEAGKLPRATFNPHGKDELHVSGDGSKDKPKFSQPANQEQPVRKAGIPQQHPNTYGMRYGMKGGVKKVWCPEHQMWEETRKDWHE